MKLYTVYLKIINGEDIMATLAKEFNNKELSMELLWPAKLVSDYNGLIDPDEIYLEDWVPLNEDKVMVLDKFKILDVMTPSKPAQDSYYLYLENVMNVKIDSKLQLVN